MNLGSIITALEAADPEQPVPHGFTNPHSYRGDYMDLAFEPAADTTVGAMLTAARSALGATFQGWKGGDFLMDADTWCWLSPQGDASCETLSPEALAWMLLAAATVPAPAPTDQTALRSDIEEALRGCGVYDPEEGIWRSLSAAWVEEIVPALLAVLPAPTDRAAILRELADEQTQLAVADDLERNRSQAAARRDLVRELRRLADAASGPGRADGETQQDETCTNCRGSGLDPRYNGEFACPDCPPTAEQPAAVSQPGKEAYTVCLCGHSQGEHIAVSDRLLCDTCDPDSTDNRTCDGFEEL